MPTAPAPPSPDEPQRCHRHLILPDVGEARRQRLKAARELVVGAGGLDSPTRAVALLHCHAEPVVYCHHGVRSGAAAAWLHAQGFARVRTLVGGIDRWSPEVDPSLRRS